MRCDAQCFFSRFPFKNVFIPGKCCRHRRCRRRRRWNFSYMILKLDREKFTQENSFKAQTFSNNQIKCLCIYLRIEYRVFYASFLLLIKLRWIILLEYKDVLAKKLNMLLNGLYMGELEKQFESPFEHKFISFDEEYTRNLGKNNFESFCFSI